MGGQALRHRLLHVTRAVVRRLAGLRDPTRTLAHDPAYVRRVLDSGGVHRRLTKLSLPKPNLTMLVQGTKAHFTVCVEGNIGSGKSTLLKHFAQFNDVEVFQEPVEKWQDVDGHNLLALFYSDPQRWAHTFQAYVQMTMMEQHLHPCQAPVKLLERSIYSGRHCFVENLYRSGKMTDAEYKVYCEWFNIITKNLNVAVDLIVYLRTDPEVLYGRIQQRARCEEQTIPRQYLHDLHDLHEAWLMTPDSAALNAPLLVLDANDTLSNMYKKFEEHASDILCKQLVARENKQQQRNDNTALPCTPVKIIN